VDEAGGFRLAEQSDNEPKPERAALAAGGIAALLAGACCLGPLIFVSVGLTGTWLAYLPRLEPYRPLFLGIAALALAFAWRRIYRPAAECKPGEVCAIPQVKRGYKIGFWSVAVLLAFMFVFPYFLPLFY
jgi:mercuric ion transport protein